LAAFIGDEKCTRDLVVEFWVLHSPLTKDL
jgi:hypothetical protein